MSEHFQIAVIGGGPGGYVAALKAAQMGAKVAIIEKGHLGGTCLNVGCIPSKALLASAELLTHIRHADGLGIEVSGEVGFNWLKIQQRKDKVISTLRSGIKGLLSARKAKLFVGTGKLDGKQDGIAKIIVTDAEGKVENITADKVILATGSTPTVIPGWPTDVNFVCTSDEALHWPTLPKSILIIGGGVIGCEFACMLQPFGVQVTIVEMLPKLLGNMEGLIADALKKTLEKRGIKIYCGVKIEELKIAGDQVVAKLSNGESIQAAKALVATGRRPVTANIGLETVGIETDRGFIRVNNRMETSTKGFYCIGDANGQSMLAHAASAHAIAAVENALGHENEFTAPIPGAVYTFPEIGAVGITTEEALKKNIPVAVGHFSLAGLGKAMAINDTEGFARVIRHRETGELLGVHMIGHNATDCIAAAGTMMHRKASVKDLAEVVFAHPTISESIKEAAEDALYEGLHLAPRKILRVAV